MATTPEQQARSLEQFQRLIGRLERQRKSRIYCLVQTEEHDHICTHTLRQTTDKRSTFQALDTLELLIVSGGGHPDIAYKVIRFLQARCKTLHAIVPLYAKSAATLMCLGASEIFMGEGGELGPVDIQIPDPVERGNEPISPLDEFKSMEFLENHALEILDFFSSELEDRGMSVKEALEQTIPCVVGMMRPLYEAIDPIVMGEHSRSLAIGGQYAARLLASTGNPHTDDIVQKLVWGYPSHGFVIDREEARSLNLPIANLSPAQDNALVDAILELIDNDLSYCGFVPDKYRQPSKRKPAKPARPTPAKRAAPASQKAPIAAA